MPIAEVVAKKRQYVQVPLAASGTAMDGSEIVDGSAAQDSPRWSSAEQLLDALESDRAGPGHRRKGETLAAVVPFVGDEVGGIGNFRLSSLKLRQEHGGRTRRISSKKLDAAAGDRVIPQHLLSS